MPAGRPRKELDAAALEIIRAGGTRAEAAAAIGVAQSTLQLRLAEARRTGDPFAAQVASADKARAQRRMPAVAEAEAEDVEARIAHALRVLEAAAPSPAA